MKRPESWESIARALGERLAYQANNCPNGEFDPFSGRMVCNEGDIHNPDERAHDCPYCADTVAYRRYRARLRGERYEVAPSASATQIAEGNEPRPVDVVLSDPGVPARPIDPDAVLGEAVGTPPVAVHDVDAERLRGTSLPIHNTEATPVDDVRTPSGSETEGSGSDG